MIDLSDIAYCGPAPVPGEIWGAWNFDPALIGALCGAAAVAWMQGGPHRARLIVAIGVLAVAFVSPLCAMTSALFSVRAVHHLVVIAVAAPLIALSLPLSQNRSPLPLTPTFIAATVTLWAWHVPAFYTAALSETWLYWLMQLTLLGTATLFWRALFTAPATSALIAIAASIGQMGLLGALLTFAPEPLYLHHFVAPLAWGLTPLADQQLAGLIMWVPGTIPYALFAWVVARRLWRTQEMAQERAA